MDDQQIKLSFVADTAGAKLSEQAAANLARAVDRAGERMQVAGKRVGDFSYRLSVMAQTLDDLSYVGEQGLRPILNNLVMIHPALGIVAIGFETIRKHTTEIKNFGGGLSRYWGLDEAVNKTGMLADSWKTVVGIIQAGGKAVVEFGEGVDALSGGPQIRAAARGGAYMSEGTDAQKEAGGAMSKTIDNYGRQRALSEIINKRAQIDPALRPGAPGQEAEIQKQTAELVDLIERARKGDQGATLGLKQRMQGTGIGAAVERDTPGGQRARKEAQQRDEGLAKGEADKMKGEAEGLAKDLSERFTKRFVQGIPQTEDTIREELEKTMPKDKAAWFANQVFTLLEQQARDAVAGRARQMGATIPEAQAAMAREAIGGGRRNPITMEQQMGKAGMTRENQIMTRISDRTNSEGVVGDFIATARQNRFADRNYQRKFGKLGFEAQLDETSRTNARDDEMARQLEQKRLTKLGYSLTRAAKIAEENVNMARKALNGETHDVDSKPQRELADNTKELNDTMKRLERNGLIARFG